VGTRKQRRKVLPNRKPASAEPTKQYLGAVLVFLLAIAAFWPSRSAGFVWDDQPYNLAGNPALMRGEYAAFWRYPYRDFYIPVSYSVWTAIAELNSDPLAPDGGLRAQSFHTLNIVIHAANAVLAFLLIYQLLASASAATVGAALFAIHPLQVESVVWISELRGLLAAFFSLIALLLHCRYRQKGSTRIALAVFAIVSFVLGALSKPSALTLPVALVALDWFCFRARLPRRWWLAPMAWVVVTLPMMIVAKRIQPDTSVEFVPPVLARLRVAADALTFYIGKLLVPWPLSPSYGRTPQAVIGWRMSNLLWTIPIAITYLVWRYRSQFRGVTLAAIIAFSSLLPVLGLVPFKGQNFSTVADRYMYFPLLGVALAVSSLMTRVTMTRSRWLFVVAILGGLLVVNVHYQHVWADELTLWRHASTAYPNQARVHNNYGVALQAAGSHDQAIVQFDRALQARANFADAYCNRGISLARLGRYSDALADETRALGLDSSDSGCWYDRAVTLFTLGRFAESLQDAEEAKRRGFSLPSGFEDAVRYRLGTRRQ